MQYCFQKALVHLWIECVVLLQTLLRALLWPDSPSSARSATLLECVMPVLASSASLGSGDAAHLMFTVLNAIHKLGHHDMNYISLTQVTTSTHTLYSY